MYLVSHCREIFNIFFQQIFIYIFFFIVMVLFIQKKKMKIYENSYFPVF